MVTLQRSAHRSVPNPPTAIPAVSDLGPGHMNQARVLATVRVTARASSLLFAAAHVSRAHSGRSWRPLYLLFVVMHAIHFAAVARFATVTKGRDLFPGGRSLNDAGGWPTVVGIYTMFFALAYTGWAAEADSPAGRIPAGRLPSGRLPSGRKGLRRAGRVATGLLGAMFVSAHVGQVRRARWHAVPAALVGAAVLADIAAGTDRRARG